jgi:hypothetical protein
MLNLPPDITGNGEIRVWSGDGVIYVAPVLILHYVKVHGYRPPQSFVDAVLRGGHTSKPMFRVIVHGRNLLTDLDGVRQRAGFFTNVFVEAFTAADAESRALELVREDTGLRQITLNGEDDPLKLTADQVFEVGSFDGARPPRSGLSLYRET